MWTYKNADEKAHTFLRRSKNGKKRKKTDEKRILCKFALQLINLVNLETRYGPQKHGKGMQFLLGSHSHTHTVFSTKIPLEYLVSVA